MTSVELNKYLDDSRELAMREIREIIPREGRCHRVLYDLMFDYPLRPAKALRPALCIATCRALGGTVESIGRSAAIVELYHNAFLIHDDVEDGSENRRDGPTLHRVHGTPIAVNVGDAMLALALEPLLDNMRVIGMGKALRVLQIVARMARESAEGQALELDWIRNRQWQLTDTDYVRMVYKKTSWYTFITPILIGGTVAGASADRLRALRTFAALLGVAFQIQDDVLNLVGETGAYGKEIAGDLWEGKHTLIVMHMMRTAGRQERARARRILAKPRPRTPVRESRGARSRVVETLRALEQRGELGAAAREAIEAALERPGGADGDCVKSEPEVRFLLQLIRRCGSIEHARSVSRGFASKAQSILSRADWIEPSVHRDFLESLVEYVIDRDR
jgi:geranylgeranyl diphosphate synthase type II